MRRFRYLVLFCAVVATATGATQAHPAVPTTQTCQASVLRLSFTLPSDWLCGNGGNMKGSRYGGVAPGRVAFLDIYTGKAERNVPVSAYAPTLVAALKKEYARAGTGLTVKSSNMKVGYAVSALGVSASYRGYWLQGSGELGQITHLIYFFVRGGLLYEFDYSSVTPWATKYLPSFATSAKSIHFLTTA